MNGVRHQRQEHGERTDAAHVVALLRRTGPLTLHELLEQPELRAWQIERVESAVTVAWANTMIFVDTQDQLVPL